jgi:uncharacterized protein (DUF433 family)
MQAILEGRISFCLAQCRIATANFRTSLWLVLEVLAITGHKTLQMLKRYTHLKAEDLAKMLG